MPRSRVRLIASVAAAFVALFAAVPGRAEPPVAADGEQAFAAGRFADALAIWSALASKGDREAELGMGVLYDLGDGVPPDHATALGWYRRAAEAGLAAAELNVAVMYDTGRGTPRDAAQAALWYGRAAAHHNHRAEYDLAQLYARGDGVPRNEDVAEAWLRAAAAGGPDAAGERLTRTRRHGARVPAGTPLVAALPAAPQDGATVRRDPAVREVELVWTAPAQPALARFFVQFVAAGAAGPVPVFSGYTETSSILVPLNPAHSQYLWRVYVVGATLRSYLPSAWSRFTVIWRGARDRG